MKRGRKSPRPIAQGWSGKVNWRALNEEKEADIHIQEREGHSVKGDFLDEEEASVQSLSQKVCMRWPKGQKSGLYRIAQAKVRGVLRGFSGHIQKPQVGRHDMI